MASVGVLIDEPALNQQCRAFLSSQRFRVRRCRRLEQLAALARDGTVQAAVIDSSSSVVSVGQLRRAFPALVIVAFGQHRYKRDERLALLALGVDCAGSSREELALRLCLGLNRGARVERPKLELRGRLAKVGSREFRVGPKGALLLRHLIRAQNEVVSRDVLKRLSDEDPPLSDTALDQHVQRLRSKLGEEAHRLETVRRDGYRLLA